VTDTCHHSYNEMLGLTITSALPLL